MARTKLTSDDVRTQVLARQAAILADHVAKALAVIQQARIETEPLLPFPLDKSERGMLAGLTALPAKLRTKLSGRAGKFTVAEVISLVQVVADSFPAVEPERQMMMLNAANKLWYYVHSDVLVPVWEAEARKRKPTRLLYQLKITLVDAKPAIWRRIQVKDCTLDKLHEHIQTAMGWTNSHLHRFEVDGQPYADPELMEESFAEMNCRDSTITLFSYIVPQGNKPFRFQYE